MDGGITWKQAWWVRACAVYLGLPCLLFFWGWLHVWAAFMMSGLLLWGIWRMWQSTPKGGVLLSRGDFCLFLLLCGVCFAGVFLCGFSGHCQQHGDFVVRNLFYDQLCMEPWPCQLGDTEPAVYYFGHWLVPAALARYLPSTWSAWLLMAWTWTGMILALGTACASVGVKKTTAVLVCFVMWNGMLDACRAWGLYPEAFLSNYAQQMVTLPDIPQQLFNTFNHFVPALTGVTLLLSRQRIGADMYLVCAMLLISSPLGVLLLLPYVVYRSWRDTGVWQLAKQPGMYIAGVFALLMAMFYAHTEGGGQLRFLLHTDYAEFFHYRLQHMVCYEGKYVTFVMAFVCNILLPAAILWHGCKRLPYYYITWGLMTVCILFRMGIMNNELLFKAPTVLFPIIGVLTVHAFACGSWFYRVVLAVWSVFVALPSLQVIDERIESMSFDPRVMQRHIVRADLEQLQRDPDTRDLLLRQFRRQSAHPLPGWLFRKAD